MFSKNMISMIILLYVLKTYVLYYLYLVMNDKDQLDVSDISIPITTSVILFYVVNVLFKLELDNDNMVLFSCDVISMCIILGIYLKYKQQGVKEKPDIRVISAICVIPYFLVF